MVISDNTQIIDGLEKINLLIKLLPIIIKELDAQDTQLRQLDYVIDGLAEGIECLAKTTSDLTECFTVKVKSVELDGRS